MKTFEKSTVNYGADSFNWTNPHDSQTYVVKFAEPIKFTLESNNQNEWKAELTAMGFCVLGGRTYTAIAERYFDRKPTKADLIELHANAKLIAAAPDLMAACKFLVSKYDGIDHKDIPAPIFNIIGNQIKEAITKAEAE